MLSRHVIIYTWIINPYKSILVVDRKCYTKRPVLYPEDLRTWGLWHPARSLLVLWFTHMCNITWHWFFTVKLKSWLRCYEGVCRVHLFTTTHVMFGGVVVGSVGSLVLIWLPENELVQVTPSSGIREETSKGPWDWQHVDISSKRCDDSNIEHTLPQTNSKFAVGMMEVGEGRSFPFLLGGWGLFSGTKCQF